MSDKRMQHRQSSYASPNKSSGHFNVSLIQIFYI